MLYMNILILNWRDPQNPKAGGAEYVTMKHALSWVKRGHSVTWLAASFEGAKTHEEREGVRILRQGNIVTVFWYAFAYYRAHKNDIDLIIDEVHGVPFFSKLYVKKPIIVFIHEVAGDIWHIMYPFPISLIGRMLERFFLWLYRDEYFWTDAASTLQELRAYGVRADRSVAIACPIENKSLHRLPKKNTVPTFLFVGRIVRMKGVDDVLLALRSIVSTHKKAVLWVVGDGDAAYVEKLRRTAITYGISDNIIWYGKVSQDKKLTLMAKAHVLLHASVKEGWGLVVLEAASQGTPTVAYAIHGLVDTIKDRHTGVLTKKNTPEHLSHEAINLYRNKKLYQSLQKNGLQWSRSFTWSQSTKESITLLSAVYKSS